MKVLAHLALIALAGALAAAPLPFIYDCAGDGTWAYSSDNIPATSASLESPEAVCVDGAGNLYEVEYYSPRVRKVTASTGLISTVAGNGSSGNGADNVSATSSSLYSPEGVAVDDAGNLYIADTVSSRIRKVDAGTGLISTVAGIMATFGSSGDGGLATSAKLSDPQGLVVDSAHNIYIADVHNCRVRKVDGVTGIISTIAGDGTFASSGDGGLAVNAQVANPVALALGAAGELYVNEAGASHIRKIDLSTGLISTVAWNGSSGFSGDNGPATNAMLNAPSGLAVGSNGDLYIADTGNRRIRRVDFVTGKISTFAGIGTGTYNGSERPAFGAQFQPMGLAISAAGDLFFSTGDYRVRKISAPAAIGLFWPAQVVLGSQALFTLSLTANTAQSLTACTLSLDPAFSLGGVPGSSPSSGVSLAETGNTLTAQFSPGFDAGSPTNNYFLTFSAGVLAGGTYFLQPYVNGNPLSRQGDVSGNRFQVDVVSATVTPTLTATRTTTPTFSVSATSTLSPTPSQSPTITVSATASPTLTVTVTCSPGPDFAASGLGKTVLAPVPAKVHRSVCLYFDQAPRSTEWAVFNAAGEKVAALRFGDEYSQCWMPQQAAPGIYWASIRMTLKKGEVRTLMQKIVLVK